MKVKVSQLKNNPNNPRVIRDNQFKKLVQSIKDFPEMLSVRKVVCTPDFVVLGGNMRLKALQEAGIKEVDVEIVDWNEDKQKQFIIKDNLGYGEWDWDALANEWDDVKLSDWGLDLVPDVKELSKELDFIVDKEEDGSITFNEVGNQDAHVKMVQLFMSLAQYNEFMDKIDKLSEQYGTDNTTDTIIKCVELSSK